MINQLPALKMMRWAVVTSDCGAVENLKVGARWGLTCIHTHICIYICCAAFAARVPPGISNAFERARRFTPTATRKLQRAAPPAAAAGFEKIFLN
jgi:hypothetical protein